MGTGIVSILGGALSVFGTGAAVLGGFKLVQLLSDAGHAVRNADDGVSDARALMRHLDAVLTQANVTLQSINEFVQHCTADRALHDVEATLKNLPRDIARAIHSEDVRRELAKIKGQSANLKAAMLSRASIRRNAAYIEHLSKEMVASLMAYNELQDDAVEFTMQAVPSLTTWMHGYTAYNSLIPATSRDVPPWDHALSCCMRYRKYSAILQLCRIFGLDFLPRTMHWHCDRA